VWLKTEKVANLVLGLYVSYRTTKTYGWKKNKKKIKPLSSPESVTTVRKRTYRGMELLKRCALGLEWKIMEVMDGESGDDGTDELQMME